MTITNIINKELAVLTKELEEQARIVGMSTDREYALMGKLARQEKVLKMSLDLLDNVIDDPLCQHLIDNTIDAIREALAEQPAQQQEPVAYGMWDTMLGKDHRMMMVRLGKGQDGCTIPLYTSPPQRKPLTDEQIWQIATDCTIGGDLHADKFARAIEAAHGIK